MSESRVHRLSETVANQIAAGEVVERPASVVKELVENALDAGATKIEIAIEAGGAKGIEVVDNGCGMNREDALTALERQATSKIATSEDITHIATFGFRGEAIPSIASVSRFTLTTRPADEESATHLRVLGGTLEEVGEAGHPIGTAVAVRDLFFNVPARRKFLRAPATELTRIRQTLTAIALANPAIAFRLRSEGRDLFQLPQGDTLLDRIRTLLGEAVAEALLPVDGQAHEVHVHGFLSKPDFIRGGTPEQYVFINARPATAPQIQYAIREAWPTKEHRPVVVIFIDLPPEEVDVNVHPAKREVRFRHGNHVIDAVQQALHEALFIPATPAVQQAPQTAIPPVASIPPTTRPMGQPTPQAPTLSPVGHLPTPQAPKPLRPSIRQGSLPLPESPLTSYPVLRDPPVSLQRLEIPPTPTEPASPDLAALPESSPWKWLRMADILPKDYWLLVTDKGLVTVDAKAALERICYDRLARTDAPIASQPLLLPETLHLSPADADRVTRYLPELSACGFDLTALDKDTFLINALPVFLAEISPVLLLTQLATELDRTGVKKGLDAWRKEIVTRAAAQAAAGAQHPSTIPAVEQCLAQLARSPTPYATPRGRPTMILTTYRELHRRFQRP